MENFERKNIDIVIQMVQTFFLYLVKLKYYVSFLYNMSNEIKIIGSKVTYLEGDSISKLKYTL